MNTCMTRASTSTGTVTISITSIGTGRTIRRASRIRTGIATRPWCIGIRITPTCITATATGTQSDDRPAGTTDRRDDRPRTSA